MIKGMNHLSISVANLDRSIAFYCDLLQMEVSEQVSFSGGQYAALLGLEGATGRIAVFKGPKLQIELVEFSQPRPRRADSHRSICDHGISHFCMEVSDVSAEYERLKLIGVRFTCAPIDFSGVVKKAARGSDPDGNVFELIEKRQPRVDVIESI